MGKASRRKRERREGSVADSRKHPAHLVPPITLSDSTPAIYRYLEEEAHVRCWTDGGRIPIRQALFYRSLEGETGRTDVEDAMHRDVQGMRLSQIQNPRPGPSPVRIAPGANIGRLEFEDCTFSGPSGVSHIAHGTLTQHHPHALVLCLSTELSAATARAIDPKCRFCVQIIDVDRLKQVLDEHLKIAGVGRRVQYTQGDNRDTFLKSARYRQQAEYRLAWEGVALENVWVELPPGIAERVDIPQ